VAWGGVDRGETAVLKWIVAHPTHTMRSVIRKCFKRLCLASFKCVFFYPNQVCVSTARFMPCLLFDHFYLDCLSCETEQRKLTNTGDKENANACLVMDKDWKKPRNKITSRSQILSRQSTQTQKHHNLIKFHEVAPGLLPCSGCVWPPPTTSKLQTPDSSSRIKYATLTRTW